MLNCCLPFTLVRWRPSLSAAIVTQLVPHAAFLSGMMPSGLSLIPQGICAARRGCRWWPLA
jgi:hypothetical protein